MANLRGLPRGNGAAHHLPIERLHDLGGEAGEDLGALLAQLGDPVAPGDLQADPLEARFLEQPALVASYGGDTLSATLVYLLVALAWPRWTAGRLGLLALGLCVAVELSQLVHTPWLDALRGTLPGRLVLGAGFLWSDLACYAPGVLLGVTSTWRCAGAAPW